MFKRIFSAVDGSRSAEYVLPDAVEIARLSGSELILGYVLSDDSGLINGTSAATAQAVADSYLERAVRSLTDQQVNARGVLLYGNPAREIIRYCAKNDVDAIAMTTHGRSGLRRVMLGSVADEVVRTASAPVLVRRIREHMPERLSLRGDGVLVPLDGSELAESVIPYALEIARLMRCTVILLRVVSYQDLTAIPPMFQGTGDAGLVSQRIDAERDNALDYLRAVRERWQNQGINIDVVVRVGVPFEVILDVADELNAGMIALSTNGRSGLRRAVLGSVATALLQNAHVPVMTLVPHMAARGDTSETTAVSV